MLWEIWIFIFVLKLVFSRFALLMMISWKPCLDYAFACFTCSNGVLDLLFWACWKFRLHEDDEAMLFMINPRICPEKFAWIVFVLLLFDVAWMLMYHCHAVCVILLEFRFYDDDDEDGALFHSQTLIHFPENLFSRAFACPVTVPLVTTNENIPFPMPCTHRFA